MPDRPVLSAKTNIYDVMYTRACLRCLMQMGQSGDSMDPSLAYVICAEPDDGEHMLICDECGMGYHITAFTPTPCHQQQRGCVHHAQTGSAASASEVQLFELMWQHYMCMCCAYHISSCRYLCDVVVQAST